MKNLFVISIIIFWIILWVVYWLKQKQNSLKAYKNSISVELINKTSNDKSINNKKIHKKNILSIEKKENKIRKTNKKEIKINDKENKINKEKYTEEKKEENKAYEVIKLNKEEKKKEDINIYICWTIWNNLWKIFLNYYDYRNQRFVNFLIRKNKKNLKIFWYINICFILSNYNEVINVYKKIKKYNLDEEKKFSIFKKYLLKKNLLKWIFVSYIYKNIEINKLEDKENLWILPNKINTILLKLWIFDEIKESKYWWFNLEKNNSELCFLEPTIDVYLIYKKYFSDFKTYKINRKQNRFLKNLSYKDWIIYYLKSFNKIKNFNISCNNNIADKDLIRFLITNFYFQYRKNLKYQLNF